MTRLPNDLTPANVIGVAADRIDAVRRLHEPRADMPDIAVCAECQRFWPCPTIRTLDGDD